MTTKERIKELERTIALYKLDYKDQLKKYSREMERLREEYRRERIKPEPAYVYRIKPDHIARWLRGRFTSMEEMERIKAATVYTWWLTDGGQPGVRSFSEYMAALGFKSVSRRVDGKVIRVYKRAVDNS